MIWLQGAACLLLWIGYGAVQNRRSDRIREQVTAIRRGARVGLAAALFIVSAMVLLGGLAIVLQQGGFTRDGLTPTAWLAVAALGLAFVHAQTMAMALLVSTIQENVTNAQPPASGNKSHGDSNRS